MEGDIAVLKAEKAYLARPERIEALAKKQGLGPIAGTQYVLPAELEAQLKAGGQDTSVAKAGKATLSQPDRIEALLRQQDSLTGETR
jgi:hypothetical protein